MPLIVKGARQVGKTESIRFFASKQYEQVIEINFVIQKQFKVIFDNGFEVDTVIKNISLRNPELKFIPGKTLIFFDELKDGVNCATSLKPFKQDGRFDVICSGSRMGINNNEIESNSVSYKEDYEMYSLARTIRNSRYQKSPLEPERGNKQDRWTGLAMPEE